MPVIHTVQVLAPAKINLALHVTGERSDGYHLLDSLVAFTRFGDTLTATAPGNGEFSVSGSFARDVPTDSSNLICKVAQQVWPEAKVSFHLHKDLPVASGIGGGSADAAASYRAIAALRQLSGAGESSLILTEDRIGDLARLGADIPMCVHSETARVRGIGNDIEPLTDLPALPIVLVNPGVAVSTPAVFQNLDEKTNSVMSPLRRAPNINEFLGWLCEQRNDLEKSACALFPEIQRVLDMLGSTEGCALARMSGSGGTCFGLFRNTDEAGRAAKEITAAQPLFWVKASVVNGPSAIAPQRMRSTT